MYIAEILKGNRVPENKTLLAMAAILEVPVETLKVDRSREFAGSVIVRVQGSVQQLILIQQLGLNVRPEKR